MRLYRICHVRYLEDLRGLGASYRDGARWNEPGFPIVYFAETPSVAMLEMAHYLPSPRLVPPGYRLGVYEVGDEVALERWHVRDLPEGWDRYPHPRSTRRMGTSWLMRKEAPLLAVPSAGGTRWPGKYRSGQPERPRRGCNPVDRIGRANLQPKGVRVGAGRTGSPVHRSASCRNPLAGFGRGGGALHWRTLI